MLKERVSGIMLAVLVAAIAVWAAPGASPLLGATATGETTLSISPATQEALPGTTVTYTVANAATSTETLTLTLGEIPPALTVTLADAALPPGTSTTLTVVASADAPLETTTLTVSGRGAFATESATATLAVVAALSPAPVAAAADFSLTVAPTSHTMARGGDVVVYTITTDGSPHTTIKLKALKVRKGIGAYLSHRRVAAGQTATLTIMARKNARRKAYELILKGSSDQADVRVPLTLVVQ
jgi:hypothetical protein